MSQGYGFRTPANVVVQDLSNIHMQPEYFTVGPNATEAKMKPGVGVELDGAGYVKEFDGTGFCIGTLGYEDAPNPEYKISGVDDHYLKGQRVAVHVGGGTQRRRLRLAASQTIVKGQPLSMGADGLLSAAVMTQVVPDAGATVAFPDIYADADEPVTTDENGAGTAIWCIPRR
jgi:hypothetical protein